MSQTLAQPTRTAPDYGVETSPEPSPSISRAAVPEGFRAWLPALAILIGMPLLALATTKYVLLPSFKQALAPSTTLSVSSQSTPNLFLAKIPFNVSGIRRITLVGADSAFADKINRNQAGLAKLASADLDGLTASDLYKPGVLQPARARLVADFNRALGGPVVKEIYIGLWPEK